MLSKGNPIREEQINQRISRAADSFWSAFQMTEGGKVKSTLLLYSFCLCWVFIAVYGLAFFFLVPPLHALIGGAPVLLVNLAESLVPAILGAAVCGLAWLLPGDRRLLPASYLWLALLMLACLIALLIMLRGEATALVLQFFAMFVLPPILLGGGLSLLLYYRYWKNRVSDTAALEKRK